MNEATPTQLRMEDAAALAALHARCLPPGWSVEGFRAALATPETFGVGNRDREDCLSAFLLCRVAAAEAEILTLAVAPEARRAGIASALMRAALKEAAQREAQTMFLEVGAANDAALALYAKLGFTRAGRREAYYPRPHGREDALILRKRLTHGGYPSKSDGGAAGAAWSPGAS